MEMHVQSNIAFAGLFPYKQLPLARRLERDGLRVHWIVRWRSEAEFLRQNGVPDDRVLDTSAIDAARGDPEAYVAALHSLELPDAPRMNEIILSDRHLRRKDRDFCIRYMGEVERRVTGFLRRHRIELVTTVNDTALQLLTLSICAREGIPAVNPARVRLPLERWGFFTSRFYERLAPVREPSAQDCEDARRFLAEFRARGAQVAFWATESRVRDLLSYLPRQLAFFRKAVGWSRHDRGVRHTRWTVGDLARMYVAKRRNLVWLRTAKPYITEPGARPFVMYALHMQPESTVDVLGAYFSNQLELIRNVARATPVTHDVYVKVHSGDVSGHQPAFYRALRQIPNVKIMAPEASSRALVQRADVVVTVSGTIAYEAGLLGRPAITFARMYFGALPTVHRCDSPTALPELIRELLARGPRPDETEETVAFLARIYAWSFPGEHSRLTRALTGPELDEVAEAYGALLRYLGRGAEAAA
jgi:hypothetical protein